MPDALDKLLARIMAIIGSTISEKSLRSQTAQVWSEPSVRRISTSVSVGVGMCSVVAMPADP